MKIGRVEPPRGLLSRISINRNDRCFTNILDVEWPLEIEELVDKYMLREVEQDNQIIGGRMNRHVIQHTDRADARLTLLWFPRLSNPLDFCVDDSSSRVGSGDVFLFDHTLPHSVSAVGDRTGVWYFMCKWYNGGNI